MLDWLTNGLTGLLDYPLGWLLYLPRDVAIVLVALGTSLILGLIRKRTTDQDLMRRCRNDLRRLKELSREAKRSGDRQALQRMRATSAAVRITQMRAEMKLLAASVVPIALLAIWAINRLDYSPPRAGQDVAVRAYYPLSAVDQITHLVPPDGAEMRTNAIQVIEVDPEGGQNGVASWVIRPGMMSAREARLPAAKARDGPRSIDLAVRRRGETVRHPLLVGGTVYSAPVLQHGNGKILATEVLIKRTRFLGVVPGIPQIGFAPWLVAYLLITIPLVPVLRRVLRVY